MLTVLDYGGGNLKSVANMLDFFGTDYEITNEAAKLSKAKAVLFPGQGHFGNAMTSLEKQGLVKPLKNVIAAGVPFLGICVGMQVWFETSQEAPNVEGLGVFKGTVYARENSANRLERGSDGQGKLLVKQRLFLFCQFVSRCSRGRFRHFRDGGLLRRFCRRG